MLPTVATHTPRNSRGAGGGSSDGFEAAALCCAQPTEHHTSSNVTTKTHAEIPQRTRRIKRALVRKLSRRIACSIGWDVLWRRVREQKQNRIIPPRLLI